MTLKGKREMTGRIMIFIGNVSLFTALDHRITWIAVMAVNVVILGALIFWVEPS